MKRRTVSRILSLIQRLAAGLALFSLLSSGISVGALARRHYGF